MTQVKQSKTNHQDVGVEDVFSMLYINIEYVQLSNL